MADNTVTTKSRLGGSLPVPKNPEGKTYVYDPEGNLTSVISDNQSVKLSPGETSVSVPTSYRRSTTPQPPGSYSGGDVAVLPSGVTVRRNTPAFTPTQETVSVSQQTFAQTPSTFKPLQATSTEQQIEMPLQRDLASAFNTMSENINFQGTMVQRIGQLPRYGEKEDLGYTPVPGVFNLGYALSTEKPVFQSVFGGLVSEQTAKEFNEASSQYYEEKKKQPKSFIELVRTPTPKILDKTNITDFAEKVAESNIQIEEMKKAYPLHWIPEALQISESGYEPGWVKAAKVLESGIYYGTIGLPETVLGIQQTTNLAALQIQAARYGTPSQKAEANLFQRSEQGDTLFSSITFLKKGKGGYGTVDISWEGIGNIAFAGISAAAVATVKYPAVRAKVFPYRLTFEQLRIPTEKLVKPGQAPKPDIVIDVAGISETATGKPTVWIFSPEDSTAYRGFAGTKVGRGALPDVSRSLIYQKEGSSIPSTGPLSTSVLESTAAKLIEQQSKIDQLSKDFTQLQIDAEARLKEGLSTGKTIIRETKGTESAATPYSLPKQTERLSPEALFTVYETAQQFDLTVGGSVSRGSQTFKDLQLASRDVDVAKGYGTSMADIINTQIQKFEKLGLKVRKSPEHEGVIERYMFSKETKKMSWEKVVELKGKGVKLPAEDVSSPFIFHFVKGEKTIKIAGVNGKKQKITPLDQELRNIADNVFSLTRREGGLFDIYPKAKREKDILSSISAIETLRRSKTSPELESSFKKYQQLYKTTVKDVQQKVSEQQFSFEFTKSKAKPPSIQISNLISPYASKYTRISSSIFSPKSPSPSSRYPSPISPSPTPPSPSPPSPSPPWSPSGGSISSNYVPPSPSPPSPSPYSPKGTSLFPLPVISPDFGSGIGQGKGKKLKLKGKKKKTKSLLQYAFPKARIKEWTGKGFEQTGIYLR